MTTIVKIEASNSLVDMRERFVVPADGIYFAFTASGGLIGECDTCMKALRALPASKNGAA
jgi:hypothetical protein